MLVLITLVALWSLAAVTVGLLVGGAVALAERSAAGPQVESAKGPSMAYV